MSYKIFISYPRVNKTHKDWVSAFRQDLEDTLKEKIPKGRADVFLDTREVGTGPLDESFRNALRESQILLVVLSNRWLDSPWCHSELAAFVEAVGGPEKARSRIVLARVEDVTKHRKDLKLGSTLGEIFLEVSASMISSQLTPRER